MDCLHGNSRAVRGKCHTRIAELNSKEELPMNTRKFTVITGASSGIGYEVAKAFAARGKNLIVTARRRERLEILKKEVFAIDPKVDVVIREADLTQAQLHRPAAVPLLRHARCVHGGPHVQMVVHQSPQISLRFHIRWPTQQNRPFPLTSSCVSERSF